VFIALIQVPLHIFNSRTPPQTSETKHRDRAYATVLPELQENGRTPVTRDAHTRDARNHERLSIFQHARSRTFWTARVSLLRRKGPVHQSLQSFDGQEIEVMEQLSFSQDRTTLICTIEISSSGRTVRYQDGFPISQTPDQK
jgi:hypothetical protein